MLIKKSADIPSSEITSKSVYMNRRKFLASASAAGAAVVVGACTREVATPSQKVEASGGLNATKNAKYSTDEAETPKNKITTYNNFYEFSTDKYGPAELAKNFRTRPWTVSVEGFVNKPRKFDIDELVKMAPQEERIYRHRCVEGWSMVIPWVGYSLSEFINKAEPTSKAKYVEFTTLNDSSQFPGLRDSVLDWPYTEGLRMDEAMHPLALLCFGLYGDPLPNQDGAPVRLVVPWKYGFKSIKSIVKVKFVDYEPKTAWNKAAPDEYGFYSNVNPNKDHPRWSQKTERRIDSSAFGVKRRETQMFNGYAEVADLYKGMDFGKFF
jgi:sulfoxide reductase catalytic subunit YedY